MLRVLIVEDDAILCFLNRKYIEFMGYEIVAVTTNGEDAIDAAKKHKPDVVLMDIRLQGDLDGIETASEITKFINVPIIYTTASSGEASRIQAAKNNMLGFCVKPIDVDELKLLLLKVDTEK